MMGRLEGLHQQVLQNSPEQKFFRNRHGQIDPHKVCNEAEYADVMGVRVNKVQHYAQRDSQDDESDEIDAAFSEVSLLKE